MSVIQKKLEDGVVEIFTSEKYREYMDAMSKFPRYSVNNCILIASQYPQASLVCGFRKWQKEFNRTVNKGEHQEYLRLFLAAEGEEKKVLRMMDIVEMHLQTEDASFYLADCVDYLSIQAEVGSKYGYSKELERTFYY